MADTPLSTESLVIGCKPGIAWKSKDYSITLCLVMFTLVRNIV